MTNNTAPTPLHRFLGGESGHRSFFGGTHSRTRVITLVAVVAASMVLTPVLGWPALAMGVIGCVLTLLVTAKTHRGSIVERRRKRRRWTSRLTSGSTEFAPYDAESWQELVSAIGQTTVSRDQSDKRRLQQLRRELSAMRANPDGADGMGWLQYGRGEPGIAWHAPVGEDAYLSVAFSVTGQLRGIESTSVMNRAAEGWGTFLAGRALPSVLVGNVQTMTRVLPADSALQEFWVLGSLDTSIPQDAIGSYEEVLRLTGEDAMVQRHYITVSWPISPEFRDAASKYGPGRNGWRSLMMQEIASTIRGLTDARMGTVRALTARQTAALILHQQNPSRPIDEVADVDPANLGFRSHDEFSAHVVSGVDSLTGQPVEWWHRTAAIRADSLATAPRTQLWMLDLLIGRDLRFTRSISFHLRLVPASEAKAAARQDVVRDAAETLSRQKAGQLTIDDTDVALTAAQRRRDDLIPGSHHHGAEWVGYITISETSRDNLARASRQLEETCAASLGIDSLDWMDSYQSAASGTTWPIGRGLARSKHSFSSRVYTRVAGRSDREALT